MPPTSCGARSAFGLVDDGWGWIFTADASDWNAECVGWQCASRGDRFAALQPIVHGACEADASTMALGAGNGGWPCGWITAPSICQDHFTRAGLSSGASSRPTPSSNSPRPTASPRGSIARSRNRSSAASTATSRSLPMNAVRFVEQYQCPVDRGEERLPEPRSSSSGVAHRDVTQAAAWTNGCAPRNRARYKISTFPNTLAIRRIPRPYSSEQTSSGSAIALARCDFNRLPVIRTTSSCGYTG